MMERVQSLTYSQHSGYGESTQRGTQDSLVLSKSEALALRGDLRENELKAIF